MQAANKENFVVNGVKKVKIEEGEASKPAASNTVAKGPVTGHSEPINTTSALPTRVEENESHFGITRVLGFHLTKRVGKIVTILGEVMGVDGTGQLLKISTTDNFVIMVVSELPLQGLSAGVLVDVEGLVEKFNKLKMTRLTKYDPMLYLDSEIKVESGPQPWKFDKSLYNEAIETIHAHAKYLDVTNKMEHFGTEDPKDEGSIKVIDLPIESVDDVEDPSLGFENHVIEQAVVDDRVKMMKAEETEMAADFTD